MIKKSNRRARAASRCGFSPALARAADEPPATLRAEASPSTRARRPGGHEESEQEFNWAYGFVGGERGCRTESSLPPEGGMPPPFLANVLNFAVLLAIIVGAGSKSPSPTALRKRKERNRFRGCRRPAV